MTISLLQMLGHLVTSELVASSLQRPYKTPSTLVAIWFNLITFSFKCYIFCV